ncbi:MAG: glycosyltransferase [Pseudomonadota bacterium]|nr:glycosyltransferase [Pseudomonadota bacterium]
MLPDSTRRPTISVITATLNSAADLPHLFSSLRLQSDRQFQCVIVDGGSGDGTWGLVESHRDIVTLAIREPDHGLYDALNKGIRASSTDFYVVLGADDTLNPDAIEHFKRVAGSSGADVVVAAVSADGKVRRGYHRDRAWLGHSAMVTSHSVGMLVRKILHDRFGYYSLRYPILADGYFIKRVCTADDVKVVQADFIAGEFGFHGASNRNLSRVLCESWQIQLETGENKVVQYLLFQCRLLRNLPRLLFRESGAKNPVDQP